MDCAGVREEFSALLDGELDAAQRGAVESHLAECSECLRALDKYRRVDRMYRALPAQRAPEGFEEGIRGSLQPVRIRFGRRRVPRTAVWPLVAAAAGLALVVGWFFVVFPRQAGEFRLANVPKAERGRVVGDERAGGGGVAVTEAQPAQSTSGGVDMEDSVQPDAVSSRKPASAGAYARRRVAGEADTANAPRVEEKAAVGGEVEQLWATAAPAETEEQKAVAVTQPVPAASPEHRSHYADEDVRAPVGTPPVPVASPEPPAPVTAEVRKEKDALEGVGRREVDNDKKTLELEPHDAIALGSEFTAREPLGQGRRKDAAGRTFEYRDGVWCQRGYENQETVRLARGSAELDRLRTTHKELAEILAVGERVVFQLDEQWYRVDPLVP